MMTANGDGPAFPQNFLDWHEGRTLPGLTKREWFAGIAMQGMLAFGGDFALTRLEKMREIAIAHADAMLTGSNDDT